MQKQRFLKPTIFFVTGVLMLLYLLFEWVNNGFVVEGWVYRMKNLLLPVAIFMLASDLLLKYFIRSLKWIWLAELILSLGIIYYWIIT